MNSLDKKIIEAADHHFPVYDDNAWKKMKKSLDKHLPRREDERRRFIFLLMLLLLVGGGGGLMMLNFFRESRKPVIERVRQAEQNQPQSGHAERKQEQNTGMKDTILTGIQNKDNNPAGSNPALSLSDRSDKQKAVVPEKEMYHPARKYKKIPHKPEIKELRDFKMPEPPDITGKGNSVAGENVTGIMKGDNSRNDLMVSDMRRENNGRDILKKPDTLFAPPVPQNNKKDLDPFRDLAGSGNINKLKSKKAGGVLLLSLAAGADKSAAGISHFGQVNYSFGISAGYAFRNIFLFRTGVFSTRKFYTALPQAYSPPPAFWSYYPGLKEVEADCKVIEIPFLLSYKLYDKKKHSFLLTSWLSTYLMDEENYEYYYVSSGGQPAYREYSLNSVNKHFFSVLTLAGGYQRNISKTFSFLIERFLKIPLDGVGFGKVKLNSAGILFSASAALLNPDSKRKKLK